MGLFSSKTETYVGTSVSRVIRDDMLPDSIKAAMASSLFSDTDLIDGILDASGNTLETKAKAMYRYAATNSPFGLPTGEVFTNSFGGPELQAVLDALEGQPVVIDYRHFGHPNLIHMAWASLLNSHGYDPQTNVLGILTSQKGTSVFLEDLVIQMPSSLINAHDPTEVAVWGLPASAGVTPERQVIPSLYRSTLFPPSLPEFGADISVPRIKVKYVWQVGVQTGRVTTPVVSRGEFYIYPTELNRQAEFFHVKYSVGSQTKYWMYRYGAGIYPSLDALGSTNQLMLGDFYPNIYFRLNDASIGDNPSGAVYNAMKKMTKKLGLNYGQILDAVNQNPNAGDVQSAFLCFAVNADSTDQVDLRYLYEFFDALHIAQQDQAASPIQNLLRPTTETRALRIADGAFEMDFINSGIRKRRKAGVIGPVGTYQSAKTQIDLYDNAKVSGVVARLLRSIPCRVYRKQISEGFYYELEVIKPVMRYAVYGDYRTVLGDEDSEVLLIPLDRSLLADFNNREAERLYSRSMHFVFNSMVQVKVRWYQQEWFSTLLLVVAVVLTIAAMGSDGGFFIQAAAAIAAGSYVTLAVLIAWELIFYFAMKKAVEFAVDVLGVELAFIAALVAAAYAPSAGKSGFSTSLGQVTAKELLMAANMLLSGVSDELQGMYADLLGQKAEFDSYTESKQKLLEKGEELLRSNSLLSPYTVFGESPSTYYRRTVHTGNIGTYIFKDTHNFVARSLQLPNFSTTAGGFV